MLNTDKRVFCAIAELLHEGCERITYDMLASRATVSKNTVMNAVARLRAAGLLNVTRPNTTSPYTYQIQPTGDR